MPIIVYVHEPSSVLTGLPTMAEPLDPNPTIDDLPANPLSSNQPTCTTTQESLHVGGAVVPCVRLRDPQPEILSP